MWSEASYDVERRRVCEAAAARGYEDPASLRELLICTTSTVTAPMAEAYFAESRNDPKLLSILVAIALDGEDAGTHRGRPPMQSQTSPRRCCCRTNRA
jgi:hypothetical protein